MTEATGHLIIELVETDGQELFVVWNLDVGRGTPNSMSRGLTEQELRAVLRQCGYPESVIDQQINLAGQIDDCATRKTKKSEEP